MNPGKIIIEKCMQLQPNEKCLVVTDENKREIAENINNAAKEVADSELLEIPVGKVNGEEPPAYCAEKMLGSNVILLVTSVSLTHTQARINASERGARIASMPNINKDIFERLIDVDYDYIKKITNKLADILDEGSEVRIMTDKGTDLSIDISGRESLGRHAGIYNTPGSFANLPTGEAFIAPVEGKSNGVYVVDGSFGGIGQVEEPVKITVEDGFAIKIEGGEEAEKLRASLEEVGDSNAYNIAELGIGTNPSAKITGVTLEDEKVMETCHVAVGKSKGFGGKVEVPIHIDGIIKNPDIFIDDKKILSKGELLI